MTASSAMCSRPAGEAAFTNHKDFRHGSTDAQKAWCEEIQIYSSTRSTSNTDMILYTSSRRRGQPSPSVPSYLQHISGKCNSNKHSQLGLASDVEVLQAPQKVVATRIDRKTYSAVLAEGAKFAGQVCHIVVLLRMRVTSLHRSVAPAEPPKYFIRAFTTSFVCSLSNVDTDPSDDPMSHSFCDEDTS